MRKSIRKDEISEWITKLGENSLMLTVSETHAKTMHLNLKLLDLEPIISKIINLANSFVFGKHKHYGFLNGVIVCHNANKKPHFHIVFMKPEKIDIDIFKNKLMKVASMLCKEDFKFDLTDTFLTSKVKFILTNPCYDRFVKVTHTHKNTGSYLTRFQSQSKTMYFLLGGRKVNFKNDEIDLQMKKIINNHEKA